MGLSLPTDYRLRGEACLTLASVTLIRHPSLWDG